MKRKVLIAICLLFLFSSFSHAAENLTIYHFWGEGCPVCVHSKPFLEGLASAYPGVDVKLYEVWRNKENAELFKSMAQAYQINSSAVPVTIIGDNFYIGYNPLIAQEIESQLEHCLQKDCIDPMQQMKRVSLREKIKVIEDRGTTSPGHDICVHVFLQQGCPQCQKILSQIDHLSKRYNVILNKYDVSDPQDRELFEVIKEYYHFTPASFPVVFVGKWFLVGDRIISQNLDRTLELCYQEGCPCPLETIRATTPQMPRPQDITPDDDAVVSLDLFGRTREIDAQRTSLPLFTLLIAAADSFNPCSFYILLILLSLITRTGSRKRMLLVGGIFIFLSGLIYFLFTAAWLNLWFFMGRVQIVTLIAGIIAVIVALISMKDFFFFKKGISLGIPESAKPKIFERMRGLLESPSLPAVIIGTVVLGILVNLYELLCTPGFPLVYTRVLALRDLTMVQYYSYLVFYNMIYILPLLIILVIFTVTFGKKKLTENEGRILKLISGLMMLFLGLALIFNPKLLENFLISAGMLLSAVVIGCLIIFLNKRLGHKESKQ